MQPADPGVIVGQGGKRQRHSPFHHPKLEQSTPGYLAPT